MDTAVAPAPARPTDEPLEAPAETLEPIADDNDAKVAAVLVALLAVTLPLAVGYSLWSTPTGADDWLRRVSFAPFDVVLIAAVGWTILHSAALRDLFRSRAVQIGAGLFGAAFVVALAANASVLGVVLGLRLAAGLCVIALVATAWQSAGGRTLVLASIAAVGVAQAGLGMVQAGQGSAFGIEFVDYDGPLYPFGSSFAGRGGLTHPYHLAVVLVVAQGAALLGLRHDGVRRWPWLAALAVISSGIAVTYTRSGAIGQVLLVLCLLVGRADRRRLLAPAAAAIVIGLATGALAFGDGWVARSDATADQSANPTSSRGERLREAQELFETSPAVGVGPGLYVEALTEQERIEYLPAHNLVAHQAAELGVIGGVAVVGLLGLLGLRILRGGAWTGAVVLPMVPFLLLDAYPYAFATGLAAAALWLGLARASLEPADEPVDPLVWQ